MYPMHHGATKKMRLFAKYLATLGLTDIECYIKAGYADTPASQPSASKLKNHPKVKALYEKYTKDEEFKTVATRRELMDMLSEMARPGAMDFDMFGKSRPASNAMRIKAMETLNKMRGHEITRTEISGKVQVDARVKCDLSKLTEAEILIVEDMFKKATSGT